MIQIFFIDDLQHPELDEPTDSSTSSSYSATNSLTPSNCQMAKPAASSLSHEAAPFIPWWTLQPIAQNCSTTIGEGHFRLDTPVERKVFHESKKQPTEFNREPEIKDLVCIEMKSIFK